MLLIHLSGHRLIIPAGWSIWLWRGWRYRLQDGALWTHTHGGWQVMAGVTVQDAGPGAGTGAEA
jgi:hypothetical protein